MFEWFDRAVQGVAEWGSSLMGGAPQDDPFGIAGAIAAGQGPPIPSEIGIPEFGVSSVPNYLPSGGLMEAAGRSALSAAGRAASSAFRREGGAFQPIRKQSLEDASLMGPVGRRRTREMEPPSVAPNPFSSRHPLAGWMSSLKD